MEQKLKEPGNQFTGDPYTPSRPMPEFAQRMAVETQQVVARLQNISGFIETKTFKELPALDQALLFDQKEQMTEYAKTLCLRYCMALLNHG